MIDLLNRIAKGETFENCKMKFKEIEPEEVSEYVIYDSLYEEDITLNDEIEILEEVEDKEYEDIEELKIGYPEVNPSNKYIINEYGAKCYLTKHSRIMAEKINALIRNQKYILERLDK